MKCQGKRKYKKTDTRQQTRLKRTQPKQLEKEE